MALRALTADFPDSPGALQDLTLDLHPGSYTLVAGPTGSGKSTLALALIGALELATAATLSGQCLVAGVDISGVDAEHRSRLVAAVWQRPDVQLFRSGVLDEVRSGLDFRRVPAGEADARARAALRLVGLGSVPEHQDPMTLSGGQQQRLALASALVLDAPLLVLDEATSALDHAALQDFIAALDAARAAREITVVAVDHRLEAHPRADRLVVLESGRVVLDGRPDELLSANHAGVARLGLRLPAADATRGLQAPPADGATRLRLNGVGLRRNGIRLLDAVSADLPRGATALITGDNGAGKSTLLRLLAGEVRQDSGSVRPGRGPRIRAGIGYAPQRASELMLTRTVRDELLSAIHRGGRAADDLGEVVDTLELAGLGGLGDRHPLRLSGGQRQRLAVALAVSGARPDDPALVLLDEPTSAQDRAGADQVLGLIQRHAADRITVVATHEPERFEWVATHRLHLAAGRVVGVPREVAP